MMREQHDRLQEEYANAEQIAQQGFSGLDPTIDKVALDTQKKFMEQTKMAADELATKGFIDAGRRRNLLQLKSVYLNQIVPYQQQIALRASRADEARKIQMADRSYKLSRDPMSVSLDEGLRNPNAYNYAGVSGEKVYKDTAQAMEQVKQIAAQELPQRVSSGLLNQYYTLQKHGLQPDEAAKVMAQNSENDAQRQTWSKIGKLTLDAIHGSLSRNGVYDVFKDKPEVINEFWENASDAALFGLGQTSVGNMTDEMQMYKDKEKYLKSQQNIPGDKGNIPSSTSYFEVNTDLGKKYADVEKTILTPTGQANAKYFGAHGEKNPLKEYETIQQFKRNSLDNFNKYVDNLSQKYLTKGMDIKMVDGQKVLVNKDGTPIKGQLASEYQNLQREFRRQTDEINKRTSITKDQYNHLKSIGVTPNDSYSSVVNKISTGKEFAQKAHVGYSLNLQSKGLNDLENDIAGKINTGKRILIPIDKKTFSLSTDDDVSEKDLLKGYDKDKHSSKIARAEYMPKFGGVVITNQNGDMFKVKEVMDNETTNIINTESPLVDKYLKIAEDPNESRSNRQRALDYVQNVSSGITRPIATRIAGFYQTPQATETSKNPDQVILQQNQR